MPENTVWSRISHRIYFDITHIDKELICIYSRFFRNKIKSIFSSKTDFSSEIFFWERSYHETFLRNPETNYLCNPAARLPETIEYSISELRKIFSGKLKLIDVGCGPRSDFFAIPLMQHEDIELITVDPLAETYDRLHLLYQTGYSISCINAYGETMDRIFPENSFHLVYSNNAIDHSQNPCKFIDNLYKICIPGGYLVLYGVINVGTSAHWLGLHQWNIFVKGNDLHIENKDKSVNKVLTSKFSANLVYKKISDDESHYTMIYKK